MGKIAKKKESYRKTERAAAKDGAEDRVPPSVRVFHFRRIGRFYPPKLYHQLSQLSQTTRPATSSPIGLTHHNIKSFMYRLSPRGVAMGGPVG